MKGEGRKPPLSDKRSSRTGSLRSSFVIRHWSDDTTSFFRQLLKDLGVIKRLQAKERLMLVTYLRPQSRRVALLAVLLFASIGLQLVNPLILSHFIDAASARANTQTLIAEASLFLGIALVIQIVSVAAAYVGENVGWTATNALRADLADHCIELDLAFHNAHTPGELIERVDGDVTLLANFFSQLVIRMLGNIVLLLGVLVILTLQDWRIGIAFAGFVALTLIITNQLRHLAVPYSRESRQASANLFGFLEERLDGTEDIRANGMTAYVLRSLDVLLRERWRTERLAVLMFTVVLSGSRLLLTLGTALAFAIGAYFFTAELFSIGMVYLIYQYTELLRRPLEQILFQIEDLQRASASIERTYELYHTQPRIQDGIESSLSDGASEVEFHNVSFAYAEHSSILRDLSFRVQPGSVIGLLGRTGSGKTTLARLLFRFYDVTDGSITLNGVDLRAFRLGDLADHIGLITQEVQLFHGTIRDNLTFFDRQVSDDQIMQAIDELGLGAWFLAFPNALDTQITPGGGGFSAGEAQLIAFIRIFLKQPGLVILDEASSRLDPVTERLIEHAVDRLLERRTALIIAHRLATVQRADEIMILENGRIVEYGPRKQLERDSSSRFAQLLATSLENVLA
jgi:ATP-binding cassette, subfamily B, bacterial